MNRERYNGMADIEDWQLALLRSRADTTTRKMIASDQRRKRIITALRIGLAVVGIAALSAAAVIVVLVGVTLLTWGG